MINVQNLGKYFGSFCAVDSLSFEVHPGDVVGFLGPNGAGKSTTMKMLSGYLRPSRGTAVLDGFDVLEQGLEVRRRIGYLPEGAPTYGDMTPWAYLQFVGGVRGLVGKALAASVDKVVDALHLESVLYQPVDTLSKGYKRRVGLAQSLIHDPHILILDEPTDGLDPNQKFEVRHLIQSLSKDKIIIISTHILEEVEAVCTRVLLIANGKLVANSTPRDLMQQSKTGRLDDVFRDLTMPHSKTSDSTKDQGSK